LAFLSRPYQKGASRSGLGLGFHEGRGKPLDLPCLRSGQVGCYNKLLIQGANPTDRQKAFAQQVVRRFCALRLRRGCSTATVAAALTFFPPSPPCYALKRKEGSEELEMVVDEVLEATATTQGVEIATIVSGVSGSRCGEPVLTAVPNPNAKGKGNSKAAGGKNGGGGGG
ncbi:unnamed protein product, partial [Ectocarpus fasciculatus]